MKKKIITGIVCATFGLVAAAGVVIGANSLSSNGINAVAEWNNEEVTEAYYLGAEFTLPEAKLTVGDKTVDADVALIAPDGTATRAEKTVLKQVGTYVLKYSAIIDGKPYGKEIAFDVRGDIITYNNEETKIGYQTCAYASDPTKEYFTVSLAQSDTITFSQLIDVSDITRDDKLIDLFVSPATEGIADFDNLFYLFTDSANPDIYLKVRLRRYLKRSGTAYYLSGGNGQELKGYEAGLNKLHVNDDYGAPFTNISFDAKKGDEPVFVDQCTASFRYDAATRATYAVDYKGGLTMIIDQDSTQYYENLWTGFPSGKVSLSIWAENYNSASATFCITSVRGIDLSVYGGKFEENTPPVIDIDSEYETMPEAKLGGAYTIPKATAIDDYSGICDVDVSVWYNYATSNAILVDVADGAFVANRKGYYAIVYTATDRYGNQAQEVLSVHAGNEIPEIQLEPLFAPVESAILGEWLTLPNDFAITGGSGNKNVTITVSNGTDVYEVEGDGFRPETIGDWTVLYTATDYVGGMGTYTYSFKTELPTQPILVDSIALPQIFISAQPYAIPEIYANDYRSGALKRELCEVEVTDATGTNTYKAGGTFNPTVNENGDKVSVLFKVDGVTLKSFEIPTILAWVREDGSTRLQEQNYFYGEGFTTEKTGEGLKIIAEQENATWTFANVLVSQGLNIALIAESGATNYDGYEMTLTDAENSENAIRIKVAKNGNKAFFNVFGSDIDWEIYCNLNEEKLEIGFEDNCFLVNGTPSKVEKTISGEAFEGFASSKVFASVKMIDAEAGAAYKVVSINGNPFTGKTRDQVSPNVTIFGDYGGTYALNSEYVVNAAVASDVLSPNVNFTMSVMTPSGSVAKDVNGKELRAVDPSIAYTILLSEYGQYTVMYEAAEDSTFAPRPNPYNFLVGINVVDMEAPEITFDGQFQTSAKVGDVLVIPDFTVSDNLSAVEDIIVAKYVSNPYGGFIKLINGNSIKVAHAGIYEFRIIAIDAIGNVKMIQAYVTVTE